MDNKNSYIDEIKKVLPKNMKKEKIEHIESIINKILQQDIYDNNTEDNNNKDRIKELKRENMQLRLDNLKIHEENKKIHKIILKLNNDNKELRESNDELVKIVEDFEKINIKGTVGIYTEE